MLLLFHPASFKKRRGFFVRFVTSRLIILISPQRNGERGVNAEAIRRNSRYSAKPLYLFFSAVIFFGKLFHRRGTENAGLAQSHANCYLVSKNGRPANARGNNLKNMNDKGTGN